MTPGTRITNIMAWTACGLSALVALGAAVALALGDIQTATEMIISAAILTLAGSHLFTQHALALQRQELARLRARTWEWVDLGQRKDAEDE